MPNKFKNYKCNFIILIIVSMLTVLSGCTTELEKGDIVVMPAQNPVDETLANLGINNAGNSTGNLSVNSTTDTDVSYKSLSNYNSQNYYIRPQSKTILNIPLEDKWLDFDVINGLLYLIGKTGENSSGGEYSNKITVYDVDGQQLLNSIREDNSMFMGITQLDNKIYAYDYKNGCLNRYSTDLKLEEKYFLLKELACSKMVFSKDGWLIMLVFEDNRQFLYIFDNNFKLKYKVNPRELATSLSIASGNSSQKQVDIRDLDIYDSSRIILKIIPQRLCLYNFKDNAIEKVSYLGSEEAIISFDSNILYSTISSLLDTNRTGVNAPNQLQRIFINENFTWDVENKNIEKWMITPLELPSNGLVTAHQKMKCRGRFIYMLDYPVEGDNLKQSEILIVNK